MHAVSCTGDQIAGTDPCGESQRDHAQCQHHHDLESQAGCRDPSRGADIEARKNGEGDSDDDDRQCTRHPWQHDRGQRAQEQRDDEGKRGQGQNEDRRTPAASQRPRDPDRLAAAVRIAGAGPDITVGYQHRDAGPTAKVGRLVDPRSATTGTSRTKTLDAGETLASPSTTAFRSRSDALAGLSGLAATRLVVTDWTESRKAGQGCPGRGKKCEPSHKRNDAAATSLRHVDQRGVVLTRSPMTTLRLSV